MYLCLVLLFAALAYLAAAILRLTTRRRPSGFSATEKGRALGLIEKGNHEYAELGDMYIAFALNVLSRQPLDLYHIERACQVLARKWSVLGMSLRKRSSDNYPFFVHDSALQPDVRLSHDNTVEKVMEHELSIPFNLKTGPLWRCVLAPNVAHEVREEHQSMHQSTLVFTVLHTIMDGISAVNILGDLVNIMDKVTYHTPMEPLAMTLDLPMDAYMSHNDSVKSLLTDLVKACMLKATVKYRPIAQHFQPPNLYLTHRGAEIVRNPSVLRKTCILTTEFSENETHAILQGCKHRCITMQGALQAAATVAMATLLDADFDIEIPSAYAIDARRYFYPSTSQGTVGNIDVVPKAIVLKIGRNPRGKFWQLAKQAYKQIQTTVQDPTTPDQYYQEVAIAYIANLTMGDLTRSNTHNYGRLPELFMVSNLGRCALLSRPKNSEVMPTSLFVALSENESGYIFSHMTSTIANKLCWCLAYQTHIVSEADARKQLDIIKQILLENTEFNEE